MAKQETLKVTAHLASDLAILDDWSPSLDAILEWLLLAEHQLAIPNPSLKQVVATRDLVDANLPLSKGEIGGEWYWQVSSPCYFYYYEQQSRFRRRWAPGIDSPEPDWGKRKAAWDTSQGPEKADDLPLFVRGTVAINWFVVGDPVGIEDLLLRCSSIGKKRSHGFGQILRWEITNTDRDRHLFDNGKLMRPVPLRCLPETYLGQVSVQKWGWRPPAWLPSNIDVCAMPIFTARKINSSV